MADTVFVTSRFSACMHRTGCAERFTTVLAQWTDVNYLDLLTNLKPHIILNRYL